MLNGHLVQNVDLYDRIAELIARLPLPNVKETALERRLVESISIREQNIRILMHYDAQFTRQQFSSYCHHLEQFLNQHLPSHHISVVCHQQQPIPTPHKETLTPPTSVFGKAPIFMVGSGKGGVGKSTVAFALAQSFVRQKKKVALIDADIYGPSLPTFLHDMDPSLNFPLAQFQPLNLSDGCFLSSSLGFYMSAHTAPLWRGPMLKKALDQIIFQHTWPTCDVVIIDLPPGTGDVILSLTQALPLTGLILVTTPHRLALADLTRTCTMAKQLNLKITGVATNMCAPTSGSLGWKDTALVQELAEQNQTQILAEIPFLEEPLENYGVWDELRNKLGHINTITDEGECC